MAYVPSPQVAALWGSPSQQPSIGGFTMPTPQRYAAPERAMYSAVADMTGGNNYLGNAAANREIALNDIQREAQLRSAMMRGKDAIAQLKRQQWMAGTRSLADGDVGAVLKPEYFKMRAANPVFNPNGVNGGVAFQDGQPVGFRGGAPEIAPPYMKGSPMYAPGDVRTGQFTSGDREAFNRALWARVNESVQSGDIGGGGDHRKGAPRPFVPTPFLVADNSQDLAAPPISSHEASTRLWDAVNAPLPEADDGIQTIAQASEENALNRENAEVTRNLDSFNELLPYVKEQLKQTTGSDVTEDQLVKSILADEKNPPPKGMMSRAPTADIIAMYAHGLPREVIVKWAKEYKKSKK